MDNIFIQLIDLSSDKDIFESLSNAHTIPAVEYYIFGRM